MSFRYLDTLALRVMSLRYVSPPICRYEFSSTGSQTVVLQPLEFRKGPTGVSVNRLSGSLRFSWNSYPGVICYTVYKLEDPEDPFSPYVAVARCIQETSIEIPETGCETYLVTGLTPDGETASSETFTIGPDCEALVYWNTEQTVTATCPEDFVGAPSNYVVAGGLFGAKTQAEADQKAREYALAQAQAGLKCSPETCFGVGCTGGTEGVLAPVIGELPTSYCVGEYVYAVLSVEKGRAPVTVSVSGTLPPGLALDTDTLELFGTVTGSGYFQFTVFAVDSSVPVNQTSTRVFGVNVDRIITDADLPTAAAGANYEAELEVSGPTVPVKWVVTQGQLPNGLVLDENTGKISGTPTELGQVATFTVEATLP